MSGIWIKALLALAIGTVFSGTAIAQTIKPAPVAESTDANGVSLLARNATFREPSVGIGPKAGK